MGTLLIRKQLLVYSYAAWFSYLISSVKFISDLKNKLKHLLFEPVGRETQD